MISIQSVALFEPFSKTASFITFFSLENLEGLVFTLKKI